MAKKDLKKMKQTDGKIQKPVPTTLDQIWGDTGMSKYGTMDKDVYLNQLNEMNRSDLQLHAIKIGLIPNDDRNRLIKSLVAEFTKYVNAYKAPQEKDKSENSTIKNKDILKILAEGR